jgi:hypothetical protein
VSFFRKKTGVPVLVHLGSEQWFRIGPVARCMGEVSWKSVWRLRH